MFIELKLDVKIVWGFGIDKLDLWIFVFDVEMVQIYRLLEMVYFVRDFVLIFVMVVVCIEIFLCYYGIFKYYRF